MENSVDPPSLYPKELNTLGHWIRNTRLDRGLTQEQAGVMLRVTKGSVTNWELGRSEPEIRYYPKIITFIGYCPYVSTADLGKRVKLVRRAISLSQKLLAEILQVDKSSLASWERQEHRSMRKSQQLLLSFLLSVKPMKHLFPRKAGIKISALARRMVTKNRMMRTWMITILSAHDCFFRDSGQKVWLQIDRFTPLVVAENEDAKWRFITT